MEDWATEFAHEILKSEAKTTATWSELSRQLHKAISEVNKVLGGKSQTKLALEETTDMISVTSNLNRKASFHLDAHARAVSVAMDRTIYNFDLTEEPQKLAAGTPLLPGVDGSSLIDVTAVATVVIKAVVDLKG